MNTRAVKANPFAFAYVPFLLEVQIKRQEIVARLKKCIERLEFLKTAERLKTRKECLKKLQKVIDRLKKRKKLGKGFITIFPVYKQNVKHVTYTTMGLYELLTSLRVEGRPSSEEIRDDPQKYWSRYFDIPKHFGYSFATNGVSVSKSMVRSVPKKKISCKKQNRYRRTNRQT